MNVCVCVWDTSLWFYSYLNSWDFRSQLCKIWGWHFINLPITERRLWTWPRTAASVIFTHIFCTIKKWKIQFDPFFWTRVLKIWFYLFLLWILLGCEVEKYLNSLIGNYVPIPWPSYYTYWCNITDTSRHWPLMWNTGVYFVGTFILQSSVFSHWF